MFLKKKISKNSILLIKEITDNLNNLVSKFKEFNNFEEELNTLDEFKNNKRKLEWLSVRLLICDFFKEKTKIYYDNFGKPFLKNNYKIGISHSKNLIVVALSKNEEIGVDVEFISNRIKRIAHKFLHKAEIEHIDIENDLLKLHLHWCAKEALYKIYGKKELSFINNLRIEPIDENENSFVGHLITNDKTISYQIQYTEYKGFVVVWANK